MKTVGGLDFLLLLNDSTFRAMSPVSLTLVFVDTDVCAFILKVNRSDVPCVCVCVCLAGCLSFMEQAVRAPLLCPGPVSDGQFYSPPESLAGQRRRLPWKQPC